MTNYINEYMELSKYRDMTTRSDVLKKIKKDIEFDTFNDWCDQELSDLVIQLCANIERYQNALSARIDSMTEEFYDKLDYSDEKNKKSFWKRIFRRRES